MVSDYVPSLIVIILSLKIRNVEAVSHVIVPQGRAGVFESTLSSNKTCIGDLKWQLVWANLDLDAAVAELDSIERSLRVRRGCG